MKKYIQTSNFVDYDSPSDFLWNLLDDGMVNADSVAREFIKQCSDEDVDSVIVALGLDYQE